MKFKCWLACMILVLQGFLQAAQQNYFSENGQKLLTIGRFAYSTPRQVLISHHAMFQRIAEIIGYDGIEMKLYLTYEDIGDALKAKQIDLGWLGTSYYSQLEEKNFYPIISPVWEGRSYYQGQIIARSDSSLTELSQLKGKSMAFVSESSSSGFYFPRLLLKQSGVDLSDLSEYSFLHAHSAVAYAVLTRRYDAGAAYKGILDRTEFVHEKQQFRVIGLTEIIRNEPIVIRDDFPSELAESVRNAFLKVAEEEVISQVKNLTGFVPVEDSDYDSVRRLMSYAE